MPITTLTSREFNQDASRAKREAEKGPVFITDRGRPAHVLMSIADYTKLAGRQVMLSQALAQKDSNDFDFEPPRAGRLYRAADLA